MRLRGMTVLPLLYVTATGASAQEEAATAPADWFSTNVAVTSDYAFRGISQTLEEPAVQAGIDLEHPSGFYLGTWGSSVNFGEDLAGGPRAQVELDVYGGYALGVPGVADLDLGVLYYMYPGAHGGRNYDFLELGVGAERTLGPVETGLALRYSPDFFASSGSGVYYGASLGVPVGPVSLGGSIGRQTIERNDVWGTPDYTDYSISASVGVLGFGLNAAYVATTLDEGECFGGTDLCDGRVVLSISH